MNNAKEQRMGAGYAAFAYLIWGFLPLYWKPLHNMPSADILSHRILWSFVFMLIVLFFTRKSKLFLYELKGLFKNFRSLFSVFAASLLISANWLIYIWAVNSGHVVESSLGYYINPLVSVLLGVVVLKEKLSKIQVFSILLAAAGVFLITLEYGKFPWIAISLALTFGVYGLAKKLGKYDSILGLTFETMLVTPFALVFLGFSQTHGNAAFGRSVGITFLLMGAGIVTAIPLLCFAQGTKQISLTLIGFLQYIAPTLMLLLGIFLYHESFSLLNLVSFGFIWSALIIYSISRLKWFRKFTKNKKISKIA